MIFSIAPCKEEDLKRAEELTVRTNQLNTTGYTYSYEELDAFRQSPSSWSPAWRTSTAPTARSV
jgi:predicted enzyme involved in methoxymalonyl-ACP biosynthesis